VYLPSTLPNAAGSLFWSITRRNTTNELLIKIANTDGIAQDMMFRLPFANIASKGIVQLLTGSANASNTPDAPCRITPSTHTITTGATVKWTAPGFSVAVIKVVAS